MSDEPTTKDILDAIHDFADDVQGQFEKIEATMVTKDYLDDKLADLRGDLVVLVRKEDTKLTSLVKTLHKKEVLSDNERNEILELEPFAKTS